MATEFITHIPDDELVASYLIGSIKASTDADKVDVRVIRDIDGDNEEIFSTTLYPFNNVVELTDVDQLIETNFRANDRVTDWILVSFNNVNIEFQVLYCSFDLGPDFNPVSRFWTTSATALVHKGSVVAIPYAFANPADLLVKVVGLGNDGYIAMVERTIERTPQSRCVFLSVDAVINFAIHEAEAPLAKVSYFSISYGRLQKIFYLMDDPFFLSFKFRNIFNAIEYIDVAGKLKRKTVAERDTAVCNGVCSHYDRSVNRTYEVETGPLTADQASAIEQLILSHKTWLCANAADHDILITDHTCEADNDDDSLTSMKFTFRFTGNRPSLLDFETDALFPFSSNIFTKEFTPEFA